MQTIRPNKVNRLNRQCSGRIPLVESVFTTFFNLSGVFGSSLRNMFANGMDVVVENILISLLSGINI